MMNNAIISANYFNNTVDKMENILDMNYWTYNRFALKDIMEDNITAKETLYTLLSKHPNWDAENGRIVIQDDIIRPFSVEAVRHFMQEIYDLNYYEDIIPFTKMLTLKGILYYANSQYLKDCSKKDIADRLNEVNEEYRIRPEMRVSKVISKIMRIEGLDQLKGYGKLFSSLADDTNPKKIRKHVIISVNPADFLMMSNGDSWDSCHGIDNKYDDPGCHCAGSISYAIDNNTFLFYTVDLHYDGTEFELQKREEREVFAYKDGVLFQSRLYPQSCDFGADEVYKNNREIVQRVIDECLAEEKREAWTCEDNNNEVNDFVYLGSGAQCYPDWSYFATGSQHCRVAFKGNRHSNMPRIQLGKKAICIECGEEHNINDTLDCCSIHYCESCGDRIDMDEDFYLDDGWYCRDCVFLCDCCNEYFPESKHHMETYDGHTICSDCMDACVWVEDIGDYIYNYEYKCVYIEKDDVYMYRYNQGYTWDYCENCDEPFRIEDLHDGLCEDCYDETECEGGDE